MKLRFAAKLLMRAKFHLSADIPGFAINSRSGTASDGWKGRAPPSVPDLERSISMTGRHSTRPLQHAARGSCPVFHGWRDILRPFVRLPDGAETGRLGRHDVDADAEVHREVLSTPGPANSRTLFLTRPVVDCAAERNGDILRADAAGGLHLSGRRARRAALLHRRCWRGAA